MTLLLTSALPSFLQVEEEVCDRKSRRGSLAPAEPMIEARAMWLEMPLKRFFVDNDFNHDVSGVHSPTARV
jgi:hypothetical protein